MKTSWYRAGMLLLFIATGQLRAESDEDSSSEYDYYAASYTNTESLFDLDCGDQSSCNCCADECDCSDECGCCYRDVPNMLGDTLDVPIVFGFGAGDQLGIPRHYTKVSDNNNVLPQNRLAFGFNHYVNVPKRWNRPTGIILEETDISEYKFTVERIVLDSDWSLNLTVPFYQTVSFSQSTVVGPTIVGDEGTQFGNLAFGFKKLLRRSETRATSVGLLVEAPTSQNYVLFGQTVLNDQWFFTPYLGWQATPNDRWYAHGFLSYRARTGRNVIVGPTPDYIQSDRLMLDGAIGYWMFRDDYSGRLVTGLSPTAELHYTTYTEDQDPLLYTTEWYNRVDMLNLTLGATAELINGASLASGIALPLRQGNFPGGNLPTDRSMDWELIIQYNHRF